MNQPQPLPLRTLVTRLAGRLRSKYRHFNAMPFFQKKWLPVIWFLLGFSKIIVFTYPMRKLAPKLGQDIGPAAYVPLVTQQQQLTALQLGRAIRCAAQYTPWESNFFPQAITARILLGWYGIPYSVCFGLAKNHETGGLSGHAWVTSGRIRVTGGESFGEFTVVGCFIGKTLTQEWVSP